MTHLDEGLEERTGEPGCEPPVVLGDAKVKVSDLDIDVLDGKEGLAVVLVGVLESNIKVDTIGTKLEVEQTVVFEWPESSLFVDPEGNVAGLKVETLNSESDRRVVLGSIGGVTLGESEIVVGNESDRVGDERGRLEREVVNNEIDILGLELNPGDGDLLDETNDSGDNDIHEVSVESLTLGS